eukprot:15285624-Ditylum_brightwellii.AAC.1
MLPYFPQPLNSKLPEDELVEIILRLIPAGWKRTMTCVNFKLLEATMEKLVEYFKGVECSETENPPVRNPKAAAAQKANKNKNKGKRDEEEDSPKTTATSSSTKKSCRKCKLYKMFGGNSESHTTKQCNKKALLSSLLDGHKKKRYDKTKKEEFRAMAKALQK